MNLDNLDLALGLSKLLVCLSFYKARLLIDSTKTYSADFLCSLRPVYLRLQRCSDGYNCMLSHAIPARHLISQLITWLIGYRNGWNRWVMVYNLPVLASPPIRVTSLSARRHLLCRGHLETWESDGSTSTGNAGAMLIFGGRIWRRQIISGGHFWKELGWERKMWT